MTPQRVTLITLGVKDLTRSKEFYENIGWRAHRRSQESIIFFQMNGLVLGLFKLKVLADDQGRPGVKLGTGAMTLAINYETIEEVDQAYAAATDAGAKVLKKPEDVFWGGYSGYYADPDDHVWEIANNPFWPLNDGGSLTLPNEDI
jgi:predicted lactoylglutathione lyase